MSRSSCSRLITQINYDREITGNPSRDPVPEIGFSLSEFFLGLATILQGVTVHAQQQEAIP